MCIIFRCKFRVSLEFGPKYPGECRLVYIGCLGASAVGLGSCYFDITALRARRYKSTNIGIELRKKARVGRRIDCM